MTYRCRDCGGDSFRLREGNPIVSEAEAIEEGMSREIAALTSALETGVLAACTRCGYEADLVDVADGPLDVVGSRLEMAGILRRIEVELAPAIELLAWMDEEDVAGEDEDDEDEDEEDVLETFVRTVDRLLHGDQS